MMSPPAQTALPLAVLADDDPLQRTLMSQALLAAGYRVIAVDNGAAAVEQVRSTAPAIVFLDVQMPELTGIEACREIRAGLGDRAPPVVVVTSCDRDEDIADGFAVGACDYLIKPVNWTVFKHRVNGWLATHVAQREAVAQAPRQTDRRARRHRAARLREYQCCRHSWRLERTARARLRGPAVTVCSQSPEDARTRTLQLRRIRGRGAGCGSGTRNDRSQHRRAARRYCC